MIVFFTKNLLTISDKKFIIKVAYCLIKHMKRMEAIIQ